MGRVTAQGLPQRKVAGILGVGTMTVNRDLVPNGTDREAKPLVSNDPESADVPNGTPAIARDRAAAEAQRKAAEIRLRAERKTGAESDGKAKGGGDQKSDHPSPRARGDRTLADPADGKEQGWKAKPVRKPVI
jgi:hypothetical protein